jgi:hypothetical protein
MTSTTPPMAPRRSLLRAAGQRHRARRSAARRQRPAIAAQVGGATGRFNGACDFPPLRDTSEPWIDEVDSRSAPHFRVDAKSPKF